MEEAEWAVEAMKSTGKPIAICMCMGPAGDGQSVPVGECAVRLAKAGNLTFSAAIVIASIFFF